MKKTGILFALLIVISCFTAAHAIEKPQVSWLPKGIVVNDAPGNTLQKNAKVIRDGVGGYIIVWEDARSGYLDIYAQRVNQQGARLWRRGGVPIGASDSNQMNPEIVADGSGGAIIIWQDYRSENFDIYAQRIDVNGQVAWAENGVAICKNTAGQFAPQVSPDGLGGAFIFWHDFRGGKGEDIYAQRINKRGETYWKEDGLLVAGKEDTEWYPTSKLLKPELVAVAWVEKGAGAKSKVIVQALDGEGNKVWGEGINVSAKEKVQLNPALSTLDDGSLVVAFEEEEDAISSNIVLQKISADGNKLFGANGKAVSSGPHQKNTPQVLVHAGGIFVFWREENKDSESLKFFKCSYDGEPQLWQVKTVAQAKFLAKDYQLIENRRDIAVVWEDSNSGNGNNGGNGRQNGSVSTIHAQRISFNGVYLWRFGGKRVAEIHSLQEKPRMVNAYDSGVFVVWQDNRNGNFDIYAQSIAEDGQYRLGENGEMVNNSSGNVPQQNAKIVEDGEGNFVVVWEDARGGYFSIYAQKLDSFGNLMWGEQGIEVCAVQSSKRSAELVQIGPGEVVVSWEDYRFENKSRVYVQKLDAAGKRMWDEEGVQVSLSDYDQLSPVIVADGQRGVLVAFVENKLKESRKDVAVQSIDANGKRGWGDQGIQVCNAVADQDRPRMVYDKDSNLIITWIDSRNGKRNSDIYAQKVDQSGHAAWEVDGVSVCRAPDIQKDPEIVSDLLGGAIVVWSDKGGGGYDIYAQRINMHGKPLWKTDGILVCGKRGTQRGPKVLSDGFSGAIIVWEDHRFGSWDIFAQRLDDLGMPMWEENGVLICVAQGTQYSPSIAKDGFGGFLIAWEDYRSGRSYNIYAQRIDAGGDQYWAGNGILVSKTDEGARNPQIATDANGTAYIVTWDDYRFGGRGIYAQRIVLQGSPQ
ncbi:MAG: hypothetical protein KKB81_06485 [Candidatus Margulisbacteria bacterium]|nr:hypothetical protein [Candidatus Margulisiibacteriota bacterium]MBU1022443.1 hypothetical protein [Candidatus Margulisiibacteriota bacterium]MBU1728427.1 hypothetical protein [Candidatus Margulisiibacteriota bacterium]MBU1954574.1 hypothetical protein [Candidatus Margulisiibacteriota bacterium]